MVIEYVPIEQLIGVNIPTIIPTSLALAGLVSTLLPDSIGNDLTKLWLGLIVFSLVFVTSIIIWGGVTTVVL